MKREKYETNRDMVKRPKLGKLWYFGCDASFIGEWEKCKVCGTRNGTIRNKK